MHKRISIVIIGAGFGGLQCAFRLESLIKKVGLQNITITILDKNRYQTYIPALYEVASASPKVSEDTLYHRANILIKHILGSRAITFIKAEVAHINHQERYIRFVDGNGIDFDYLVIACGAKTNFYNIPGLEQYALDLKDFVSALRIRRALKLGDQVPGTIIIGGGGATGVELAGEIHSCLKQETSSITIIEGNPRILPSFPENVSSLADTRLKKLGIQVKTGNVIKKVTKKTIILANGEKIAYDAFFWTGGIIPQTFLAQLPFQKEKGFLRVASCLEVIDEQGKRKDHIFALGDACITYDMKNNVIPWTAQKAMSEGRQVAYNIFQGLLHREGGTCQPEKIQFIIPISGKWAIAYLHNILYSGFLGWVLKNLVEFNYLASVLPWHKALAKWMGAMATFSRND